MLRNDDAAASPGNARERRSGMDMPGTHADSEDRTAADNIIHVADGAKSAVCRFWRVSMVCWCCSTVWPCCRWWC